MKNLMISLLTILMVWSVSKQSTFAQSDDNQLYSIRTVQVLPSKAAQFEKATKTFVTSLNEVKPSGMEFTGLATTDFNYYFAVEIDNFAEFDQNYWTEAIAKMGQERFANEVGAISNGIVEEVNHVYNHRIDLSYAHSSLLNSTEPLNYRVWDIYKFKPGSETQVEQLGKDFKALFEKYDLKRNSQLFFAALGPDANSVVNLHFAKDPVDFAQRMAEFDNTGEEGQALLARMLELTVQYERKTGYFRPDLSVIESTQ